MELKSVKDKLMYSWLLCDYEDKSTEYMLSFMSDFAEVEYEEAVEFVIYTSEEERDAWIEKHDFVFEEN